MQHFVWSRDNMVKKPVSGGAKIGGNLGVQRESAEGNCNRVFWMINLLDG